MKKYICIIIVLLFWSCQDYLKEEPKAIAISTYYNTAEEIETAVNAAYDGFVTGDSYRYMFPIFLDAFNDQLDGLGSFSQGYQLLSSSQISRVTNAWTLFYLTVRNANIVIKYAPEANNCSQEDKDKLVAEVKFLRALAYFHLVRFWGGVVIRTEENMDEIDIPRSTEDDVYQLIFSDLNYAEMYLPDEVTEAGRPTKWAAKAVIADVYFYKGLNVEASEKAYEVIQSGKYSLVSVSSWQDFDSKLYGINVINSSEEIFYFKFTREGIDNRSAFFVYYHVANSGYSGGKGVPALRISKSSKFYTSWDSQDIRKDLLYPNGSVYLSKKFIDPNVEQGSYSGLDWPLYRYADLLLLYAEASCRANNGPTEQSLEALNQVHRRAYGKDPAQTSDVDFKLTDYGSFNELVIKERGYETLFEAKRWFDLKRLGYNTLNQYVFASKKINVSENALLWPIPTTEIGYNNAFNPDTDQNPGY